MIVNQFRQKVVKMIDIYLQDKKVAVLKQDDRSYLLDYQDFDLKNSISLSLPNVQRFYTWDGRFPPYFETFLPEGYLFEVFKNILTKEHGYIDDYLIFSLLAPNIEARVRYESDFEKLNFKAFDIDEIINNDTQDTFSKLLNIFLDKNAISGVQPKTIALVKDKDSIYTKEYIIKTWDDEFPYLAENEYFSLKALQYAGVVIPNIKLSKNKRFLLVENFTFKDGEVFGFEEVLSLMDKNKTHKYQGSYEQVSKTILQFTTDKSNSMKQFFKTVVMNYLLKNGDAHLKNFGLLFSRDFTTIKFAPAYDVVTTTAYIFKDKPALSMDGKKIWHSKDTLVNFGKKYCLLSQKEALKSYEECKESLVQSIKELQEYIEKNPHFKTVGQRMLDSWKLSLDDKPIKEIDDDIIRTWK